MRLASIVTILTLISVIQAQNTTTATSNTNTNSTSSATTGLSSTEAWPKDGAKPVPKPEWLELIKGANITNAPVLLSNGANGPSTSGEDKYCDWAKSGCLGNSISSCPKGEWGLTYDDGPSDVSPILYDFLKSTNQKATLFMIGANVIKYPATVKRAFDEGHEIAIHTWTHSYMTTLSNEQIVAELKWTELAIKEIIGFSPRLFRPPYGDIDNRVRDIGTALGFTSVIWDHDTNDWMLAEKTPGFQASFIDGNFTEWVAEAATSSTGGVSLEHDIARVTVDAAIKNLPALQKAYKVFPVGQCAGVASYKEGNVTTPAVVANTTTTTTAIPAPTTKAPVVPAAASATPSQQAQNLNNKTSAASALTSGSFLTTVAVFAIAFVLV